MHARSGGSFKALVITAALALGVTAASAAPPKYEVSNVLVPPDQYSGEAELTPAPVWKPHETDASATTPARRFWISSNERGDEETPPGLARKFETRKGGITIFEYGTNRVLSTLNIEDACIPVVLPDGTPMKAFGGCAPPGAEGHPRHPHGIAIDDAAQIAWQVIEHSGLQWDRTRTGFNKASNTDVESGLLVAYDISDLTQPKILRGYVLGHAAEEVAVNPANHKLYVGNHEPSPTDVVCFLSVIDRSKSRPYVFIDLPGTDCVQGVDVDPGLNTVNGTTHVGEKMYTFNSANDTIAYSVNIRPAFDAFIQSLPPSQRFTIPPGWIIHMHDLVTNGVSHRAYQTIHTIATALEIEEGDEESATETENEITGRWVAEVDTNPSSRTFKAVRIIDLSNGQTVPAVRTHDDAVATGLSFDKLFIHAHFLFVDPGRDALLVSGEHTGNLAVVDTSTRNLKQVLSISRLIPKCVPDELEPQVHGVNIELNSGTAYVSDEGENCFYESVTILQPK
jgi:DNA-binding beta-propeller fold protein YncE